MHEQNDDIPVLRCEDTVCSGERTGRREFLQSAGCFGMAIALLGVSSGDATALPVAAYGRLLSERPEDVVD